jgi:hypothetical protein
MSNTVFGIHRFVLAIANESSWANWRSGSEFRAIRDASRGQ